MLSSLFALTLSSIQGSSRDCLALTLAFKSTNRGRMSLSGISTESGDHLRYKSESMTYSRSTGGSSVNTYSVLTKTQANSAKTHSPLRTIPGTTTKWRDPKPYGKTISEFTGQPYSKLVTYAEGFVDTYSYSSSMIMMGNDPWMNYMGQHYTSRYPDWNQNDLAQAETECLNRLADGKAELGVALLEAKKTVAMTAAAVSTLATAMLAFRRGHFGRVVRLFAGYRRGRPRYTDRWLEYQYGWRPLVDDVYNGLAKFKSAFEPALFVTAKRHVKNEESTFPDFLSGHKGTCKYDTYVTVTGMLSEEFTSRFARNANDFGIANPLSIAWELVPFSFLVDWIAPIGPVFNALTAASGLTFVGGSRTRWAQGTKTVTYDKSPYSWDSEPNGPPTARVDRFGFFRDAYNGYPGPAGYIKSPFSTGHLMNAIALLGQLNR